MSIRKFTDEDILAIGGVMGLLMVVKEARPNDFDFEIFKDEDGYYEDYFDVIIHGRRLRLRFETPTTAADSTADLVDLLGELTNQKG